LSRLRRQPSLKPWPDFAVSTGSGPYKRQLLNALRIVVLYKRLREDPNLEIRPRTFFFAGKAAPVYQLAKLII